MHSSWKSILLAGVATLGGAGAAVAQDASAQDVAEVVVTGSRIARTDYVAESPTVTLSQAAVEARGPTSMEGVLNQLPQFAANAGSASANSGAGGRANANLRGLGVARTLVLLDGRRLQPSDVFGAVDLNTISPALLQGVEVITGGASATYGSDAIAGVVNFKLKRDFSGLTIDSQFGETERGDGRAIDLSATLGGNFADERGNAVLSVSYFDREAVSRGSRPFFANSGVSSVLASGILVPDGANLPSSAVINSVFRSYGATANVAASTTLSVNPDGTLFTTTAPIFNLRFPPGEPYITINNQVGNPSGQAFPLQQPLTRYNVFARVRYDLGGNVEAFSQVNYTHNSVEVRRFGQVQGTFRDVFIPVTNPFIPEDLRAVLASRARPNDPQLIYFNLGRFAQDINKLTYNVAQVVGGLKGRVEALDATWEVYASYGKTEQSEVHQGYVDRAAYLSLVNAPDGGRSICEGGLNPFALGPPSDACQTLLRRTLNERTTFNQKIVEGSMQGRLFAAPAGDVRFAIGGDYRSNGYTYSPDAYRISGSALGVSTATPGTGSIEVAEVFAEALIPVVKDLPFAKAVNVDVAYRYSDYDTVGGVQTYKGSLDWDIDGGLRARASYQRAIRAPGLGELFQPPQQGSTTLGRTSAGLGDPCDFQGVYRKGPDAARVRTLCIANGVPTTVIDAYRFAGSSSVATEQGNTNLSEETSDTYTVGLVWRSPFAQPLLSSLSGSVDYYDIRIKDAIGVITGAITLQRCFNGDGSNPTYDANNFYCKLVQRNQAGGFASIITPTQNLAGYRSSGVDVQLDWSAETEDLGLPAGFGRLGVNVVVSYVGKYAIQSLAGAPFVNYAGTIGDAQISSESISHPRWKTVTTLSYKNGPAELTFLWKWLDGMGNSANVGSTTATAPGVNARNYLDIAGRYQLSDTVTLRGGVLNVADTEPPEWTGEGATDVGVYDILGRRFYVGVNLRF